MTLHEKIIQLMDLGFDVKFERSDWFNGQKSNTRIVLRFHGPGAVKIENTDFFTPEHMGNEAFIVNRIDKLYNEMKEYAYGHRHITETD